MKQQVRRAPAATGSRRMNWVVGGILLGLLNTFAVATYGALGASRNYVVADEWLLRLLGLDSAENTYFSQYPSQADWLLMLGVGLVIGGFLAALLTGGFKGGIRQRALPSMWTQRFGDSKAKRFAAAFLGGFLMLFGARLAGGCTSGLVLSGVAQLALAGFLFAIVIMAAAIFTVRIIYKG